MSIDFESEIKFYLENKDDDSIIKQLKNSDERNILLDDMDKKNDEISRLKLEIRIKDERETKIVNSIIEVLDSINWFSKVIGTMENSLLSMTVTNTKRKIKKVMENIGLMEINNKDDIYNYNLHNCIDVKKDLNKANDIIDEVISPGYIYRGKVIRTSEVIVIKNY